MGKSDSTEDRNLLRWVDSIENDDADYLDDWFNLAEQQEYDEALVSCFHVPIFWQPGIDDDLFT